MAQLTLEEKADVVTGQPGPCVGNIVAIPRLNFSGLCLHDGPLAIRIADYASVFSTGISAGASWDRKLLYERGYAMAEEYRAKGAHVILGPVAGPLGRSAYAGRNWEGFSNDPYLAGEGMFYTIIGHQDAGVQATAKHWIGNEQEIQRNPVYNPNITTEKLSDAVSSNIDDRTLHVGSRFYSCEVSLTLQELYAWPFANAVKAGTAAFMCSYQRINGSYGTMSQIYGFRQCILTQFRLPKFQDSEWYP